MTKIGLCVVFAGLCCMRLPWGIMIKIVLTLVRN